MSTGRRYAGAVVVEGRICVFGGNSGFVLTGALSPDGDGDVEEDPLDSAEELDLATGVWKPLPRMPYKLGKACSAFLLSGT